MELKFSNSVRNNVLIIIIYVAFCVSRTLFLKREIHENIIIMKIITPMIT